MAEGAGRRSGVRRRHGPERAEADGPAPRGPGEAGPEAPPWFVPAPGHPVRERNAVTAFTDGAAYYADLVASVRGLAGPGCYVALALWDMDLSFELVPGDQASTPAAVLAAASERGVAVRAMLNLHQSHPFAAGTVTGYDNSAAVAFVNGLPTGAAVHDDRYLYAGTHHQKIVVVGSSDTLVAYSGGMDLNANRLPGPTKAMRHDVQLRIEGPAARDHHDVVARRWADHPAAAGLPPLPEPPPARPAGGLSAQVVTTYGDGSARAGIGPGVGATTPGYTFAPGGDRSLRDLVLHAIAAARRSIYLEDQYLVSTAVSDALRAALPRIESLVVLVPDTPAVNKDLVQGWRRRRAFLDPLLRDAPEKVAVCTGTRYYVHSKVWVFDDEFAIVGSANCNRRGYSHDSEQAVGVADPSGGHWVRDLRTQLWSKHLGLPRGQVRDPLAAADAWAAPPAKAGVVPYDPLGGTDSAGFPRNTDFFWDSLVDPAGG